MQLYRTLVVGLLLAIAMMIAVLPGEIAARQAAGRLHAERAHSPPHVLDYLGPALLTVDAAAVATREDVARFVPLAPGEVIARIDGEVGPGRFLDVEIVSAAGRRGVLVLVR